MGYLVQEWQVIVRVAVEPAVFKCFAVLLQPACQFMHLAILEAGYVGNIAGIATVDDFGFRGQQLVNAIQCSDWTGDETVGRCNDDRCLTLRPVCLD